MCSRVSVPGICAILAQISVAVSGLVLIAFYPPAHGPMLLIALDGRDGARLAGAAIATGAQLRGRGPMANMLIVDGDRARLMTAMTHQGTLVIAAPASWCGSAGAIA
ncbi:MAG: hypothetical protein CVT77_05640 [Alphaproteobacteria bacterium HGW-Alphaproteobacteria-16]|nr:MAG: hypothetical protein CVT77_05640 [Alphaproteobacteria bacterium HGW-Alphaproteobacteria-16]